MPVVNGYFSVLYRYLFTDLDKEHAMRYRLDYGGYCFGENRTPWHEPYSISIKIKTDKCSKTWCPALSPWPNLAPNKLRDVDRMPVIMEVLMQGGASLYYFRASICDLFCPGLSGRILFKFRGAGLWV